MEISVLDVGDSCEQKTHKLCLCGENVLAGKTGIKQIIIRCCEFKKRGRKKESTVCYGNIKQMDLPLAAGSQRKCLWKSIV